MATSGSVDWSVSRDDIIKAAYRKVIVDEDFTPTTNQTSNAALLLNGIMKSWEAIFKVPLWGLSSYVALPTTGVQSMNIGSSGSNVTTAYAQTTLSVSALSGASTITVTSVTGISDTYYIGIELDSGTMQWTTVSGAAGSVVTLATTLTGAAASGNMVYCYSVKAARPLRIIAAYARDPVTTTDIPIRVVTFEEWSNYTNKAGTATYPLAIAYQPFLDNGTLRLWPRFTNGNYVLILTAVRPLQDFDGSTDTPDLPQEFFLPLVYELACCLAPDYSMEVNRYSQLKKDRDYWLQQVVDNDHEEGSLYFQPVTYLNRM